MSELPKILVLSPLKLEYQFLKQGYEAQGFKLTETPIFDKMYCEVIDTPFILSYAGLGKVNFALQTFKILEFFKTQTSLKINRLICAGAAGALDETLHIGDLVLGLVTIEHDYKSAMDNFKHPSFSGYDLFAKTFEARAKFNKTYNELEGQIETIKESDMKTAFDFWSAVHKSELQSTDPAICFNFKAFLGRIASGDEDILNQERATSLVASTKAHATAWEGAGAARAAASLGLDFMEIRAISDLCSSTTPQDFKKNLKLCMKNMSEFMAHMAG